MYVDPVFMGSAFWYDQVARSLPPKDQCCDHNLVHDEDHETCIAERNLVECSTREPVNLPLPGDFFVDFDREIYLAGRQTNQDLYFYACCYPDFPAWICAASR